jgi:uncharacterized membrane protein
MENVLPPIVAEYPNQLDIVGIDVSHPVGLKLYQDSIQAFQIPENRLGVPTLIVRSEVLVGVDEIAEIFPQMIRTGLASGGFEFPAIPGLDQVLAAQESAVTQISQPTGETTAQDDGQPDFLQKFNQDPIANAIALFVLIGMILCSILILINYLQGPDRKFLSFPEWVLPVLSLLGFGIASYMSYVELTQATAVCGPVGNCNSVQESPYAILFGVLPVGVLGVIGYLAILISWLLRIYGPSSLRRFFTLAVWGMAWFGVLFAIYLTFLEPFIIGATCAWCISNSIIMTLILLASTQPAKEALRIELGDFEDEVEEPLQEHIGQQSAPPAS